MWTHKPNKPFAPQLALVMVFHHSSSKLKTETCTRIVGYCWDRRGHIIFGRIVEELWDFGREDPSSVQNLVSCSVGAWKN